MDERLAGIVRREMKETWTVAVNSAEFLNDDSPSFHTRSTKLYHAYTLNVSPRRFKSLT